METGTGTPDVEALRTAARDERGRLRGDVLAGALRTMTLREVGAVVGVTAERVRQVVADSGAGDPAAQARARRLRRHQQRLAPWITGLLTALEAHGWEIVRLTKRRAVVLHEGEEWVLFLHRSILQRRMPARGYREGSGLYYVTHTTPCGSFERHLLCLADSGRWAILPSARTCVQVPHEARWGYWQSNPPIDPTVRDDLARIFAPVPPYVVQERGPRASAA